MGIGSVVRHRLGRWEVPAAEFYRSRFIDLDDLVGTLHEHVSPSRILEIGCGEGALAQRLTAAYPQATYTGIDVAPTAGRLYRGDPDRATFRTVTSADLLAEDPDRYDLVVLVDVIHHIPLPLRRSVLSDAAELTAAGGWLAIKEWERGRGLPHYLAYAADRYLSGDRNVNFPTPDELRALLTAAVPEFEIRRTDRIRPRPNNVLHLMTRHG